MTEHTAGDRLAALEQARAQIEIALEADRDWAALRQAASGPSRLRHERALAGNRLFESWRLLDQAIGDLKAKASQGNERTSDDLTRIRGIDTALAGRLADRGIARYGQIAAWRADDVRDVATALGLGRRISRQNWIEQAALLDLRRRATKPEPVAADPSAAPSGPPAGAAPPMEATPRQAPRIGLRQILEHIRNDAALRGDPPPAGRERRDEAPDATEALPAHVELPRPSEPVVAPAPDANAEPGEQDQGEPDHPAAVENSPGSEAAGGGRPEPEEATVSFVIRERVHAVDEVSGDEHIAPSPAGQAAAVEAVDAPCAPRGLEVEEAEVVIVSRPARPSAKPGRP